MITVHHAVIYLSYFIFILSISFMDLLLNIYTNYNEGLYFNNKKTAILSCLIFIEPHASSNAFGPFSFLTGKKGS